jgi:transcriptional regulator with XRE-family HTH domain
MKHQATGGSRRLTCSGIPHPVDVHVGSRVRQRRVVLGLSQEKLGEAIGLTFQQIQQYERGTNRISASRLFQLSRVLDVPVAFFFEGFEPTGRTAANQHLGLTEGPAVSIEVSELTRESLDLVRLYQRISDATVRRRLLDLARSIADVHFRT